MPRSSLGFVLSVAYYERNDPTSRRYWRRLALVEVDRALSPHRSHSSAVRAAAGGRHLGAAVASALEQLDLGSRIRPGQTVALTAGSRGIANIPLILRSTRRLPEEARGPAVSRAGDGQPRRRHRRGTAQAPRKLWHHRGVRRRAHPRLDGRHRTVGTTRGGVSGLPRPPSPPKPTTSASWPASSRTPAFTARSRAAC